MKGFTSISSFSIVKIWISFLLSLIRFVQDPQVEFNFEEIGCESRRTSTRSSSSHIRSTVSGTASLKWNVLTRYSLFDRACMQLINNTRTLYVPIQMICSRPPLRSGVLFRLNNERSNLKKSDFEHLHVTCAVLYVIVFVCISISVCS